MQRTLIVRSGFEGADRTAVAFGPDGTSRIVAKEGGGGFAGAYWCMAVIHARNNLSEEKLEAFRGLVGLPASTPRDETARLYGEAFIHAIRLACTPGREALRLAIDVEARPVVLASLGQAPASSEIPPLSDDAARWILLSSPSSSGAAPGTVVPSTVDGGRWLVQGRIMRLSEGTFTRYAVVETPSGEPLFVSIARSGVLVKRSVLGFLGPVLYRGSVEESAERTESLFRRFKDVSLPQEIRDPVLRVWVQAALSSRDARHMFLHCRA